MGATLHALLVAACVACARGQNALSTDLLRPFTQLPFFNMVSGSAAARAPPPDSDFYLSPPPPPPAPPAPPPAPPLTAVVQATNRSCFAQGLLGSCNDCTCCCYAPGTGGFMRYEPAGCECSRTFARGEVFLAIVLSAVCAVPTILASCYFAGRCLLTPYRQPARLPTAGGVELAVQAAPTAGVLRRRAAR